MAIYSIKLVDHTDSSDALTKRLRLAIQDLFTKVFAGTTDNANVTWGDGAATDAIVVHFVDDIASSYIEKQLPGSAIRGDAGGHTRTQGNVTGSEFYKHMVIGGKRTMVRDDGYGRLAFHECLHNQFPKLTNAELHGPTGGGGLATSPPGKELSDKNKEMMRTGLSTKNPQLV